MALKVEIEEGGGKGKMGREREKSDRVASTEMPMNGKKWRKTH